MDIEALNDPYLEDFLVKYDRWIQEGKVSHAARVLPIEKSLAAQPWILPAEQVMAILGKAQSIAVWPCVCRSHYQRCDNPVDVCLVLDKPAESLAAKGVAKRISFDKAAEVLRKADAHGLVHLGLYVPEHGMSAICSCCACCCHELQILQKLDRRDRLARSEYVARTVSSECAQCGQCAGRCSFGARFMRDGQLVFLEEKCFGCGLCVPTCPTAAITMDVAERG